MRTKSMSPALRMRCCKIDRFRWDTQPTNDQEGILGRTVGTKHRKGMQGPGFKKTAVGGRLFSGEKSRERGRRKDQSAWQRRIRGRQGLKREHPSNPLRPARLRNADIWEEHLFSCTHERGKENQLRIKALGQMEDLVMVGTRTFNIPA